jgi:hypothetical protein
MQYSLSIRRTRAILDAQLPILVVWCCFRPARQGSETPLWCTLSPLHCPREMEINHAWCVEQRQGSGGLLREYSCHVPMSAERRSDRRTFETQNEAHRCSGSPFCQMATAAWTRSGACTLPFVHPHIHTRTHTHSLTQGPLVVASRYASLLILYQQSTPETTRPGCYYGTCWRL